MLRAVLAAWVLAGVATAGCTSEPPDPLRIEERIVTVENQTDQDWTNVEVWVNRYFRAAVSTVAAGSRLQIPLSVFVSGYGQRFDLNRMEVNDLRLSARTAAGAAVTLERTPRKSGLAALERQRQ
jgi:hypothetical protein